MALFTSTENKGTSLGASFRNFWQNLTGPKQSATDAAGLPEIGASASVSGLQLRQAAPTNGLGPNFLGPSTNATLPGNLQTPPVGLFQPFGPAETQFYKGVEKPFSAAFVGPMGLGPASNVANAAGGPLYGPTQPLVIPSTGAGGTGGSTGGGANLAPSFDQSPIVPSLFKPPVIPKVNFESKPSVVVPQGEYDDAIGPNTSAENSAGFFNRELSDVTKTQQQVIDTRAAQPTNVQDLDAARLKEKFQFDMDNWRRVQASVDQFNATLQNVEAEVRKQYLGSGATESQIQAELSQRYKDLEPTFNRLNAELTTADALVKADRLSVQETFGASRADAKEAVDRVSQKLDFQVSNINAAYSLMNGMKDYELKVDAQKDKVRDDARALIATAITNPAMWQRATPQQIADLAGRAGMEPSMLAGLVDMQRNGEFWVNPQQAVDDAGNLPYVFVNKATGKVEIGSVKGFATVVPKSSAESTANKKLWDSASPEFVIGFGEINKNLAAAYAQDKTAEGRRALREEAVLDVARLAASPDSTGKVNPANYQVFLQVQQAWTGSGSAGPVESTTGSYTPPPGLVSGE